MSADLPSGDELDGFDPDERALCPDASCIGVLDSAGRCKVCGQQGTAAAVSLPSQSSPELAGLPGAVEEPASVDAVDTLAADPVVSLSSADAGSDDFADRQLCSDPSCIGVVDSAGRCKECGRVTDPTPAAP